MSSRLGFLFSFFHSFSLGFWAWVLSFYFLFYFFPFHIGFLGLVAFFFFPFLFTRFLGLVSFFFFFSRSFLFFVFPLLVLSKLYSVICCGVKGVGGLV